MEANFQDDFLHNVREKEKHLENPMFYYSVGLRTSVVEC